MFKPIAVAALAGAALINTSNAADYVVDVHGIVCEFCSFGVAKKVRKLSFIDATGYDKGVKVDIENQRVFIAVSDEADLSDAGAEKAALFEAIESGGYKPVTVRPLAAEEASP